MIFKVNLYSTWWPQNLHISICLMLNWYSFAKYQPNFIIFEWQEDILNVSCKLIGTILCDWHYLVACQHNSWANFFLRQHRKQTILFNVKHGNVQFSGPPCIVLKQRNTVILISVGPCPAHRVCDTCTTSEASNATLSLDQICGHQAACRVAQKLHISICLMLNWHSFVKSQPPRVDKLVLGKFDQNININ